MNCPCTDNTLGMILQVCVNMHQAESFLRAPGSARPGSSYCNGNLRKSCLTHDQRDLRYATCEAVIQLSLANAAFHEGHSANACPCFSHIVVHPPRHIAVCRPDITLRNTSGGVGLLRQHRGLSQALRAHLGSQISVGSGSLLTCAVVMSQIHVYVNVDTNLQIAMKSQLPWQLPASQCRVVVKQALQLREIPRCQPDLTVRP